MPNILLLKSYAKYFSFGLKNTGEKFHLLLLSSVIYQNKVFVKWSSNYLFVPVLVSEVVRNRLRLEFGLLICC
jgi:hypothetical protein